MRMWTTADLAAAIALSMGEAPPGDDVDTHTTEARGFARFVTSCRCRWRACRLLIALVSVVNSPLLLLSSRLLV